MKSLEERFWDRVDRTHLDGCWLWQGWSDLQGYGRLRDANNKVIRAHRLSFYLHHGVWPEPMCLHSCDNPKCVNPSHLKAGTRAENSKDMWNRARRDRGSVFQIPKPRGEQSSCVKLTEAKVRRMRELWGQGASYSQLSSAFAVGDSTVRDVISRRTWGHVQDETKTFRADEGVPDTQ